MKPFKSVSLHLFCLFSIFSVCLHVSSYFDDFEGGSYTAYMNSLILDGDLNIINNVAPSNRWLVTKNFNHPDMHDHGAPVLWAPYLGVTKLYHSIFTSIDQRVSLLNQRVHRLDSLVILLLSITMGLISFVLLRRYAAEEHHYNVSNFQMLALIMATGFFNYWLRDVSTADLTAFFVTVVFLIACSELRKRPSMQMLFLIGLLLGLGKVIKISFILLTPVLLPYYWAAYARDRLTVQLRNLASLSLSFGLIYYCLELNNFIKFGLWNPTQGYEYSYSWFFFLNLDTPMKFLFGPTGLFFGTPIYFLIPFMFIHTLWKIAKNKTITFTHQVFLMLSLSFLTKIMLSMMALGPMQGFGSRMFLVDIPCLLLAINLFYQELSISKKFKNFFLVLCLLWTTTLFFWSQVVDDFIIEQITAYYIQDWQALALRAMSFIKTSFWAVVNFPRILFYELVFLPLVFPLAFLSHLSLKSSTTQLRHCVQAFIILFAAWYITVTGLNFTNNSKHVQVMKEQGLFENAVVASGPNAYVYDEMMSSLPYSMNVAKWEGNREIYEIRLQIFLEYLDKMEREILVDPINLKESIKNREIRLPSFFDYEFDINSVFDYDAPPPFAYPRQ